MKHQWILAFVALSLPVLSACTSASIFSNDECNDGWNSLSINWVGSDEDVMYQILNVEHPPDTVGELLQQCIRHGWRPIAGGERLDILTCGGRYTMEELKQFGTVTLEAQHCESTPSITPAVPTQVPISALVVGSGRITAAIVRDSSLEAQIPGVNTPPAGHSYHGWLLGDEGVEPLHLNLEGTVDRVGGELLISYSHPEGRNLLATYTTFVVSLEDEGSVPAAPSMVILQGSLDPITAQLIQLADEETGRYPLLANLRYWLPLQVDHFVTHSGFALDGVQRSDFSYVRTHLEHSLNIIEGRSGELYGDWDGNGRAENPGDNVGIVVYLALLRAASEGGSQAEIQRGGSGEAGVEIADRASEIGDLLFDIRETVRQILLADAVGDISAFGYDSDLEIQRQVKALIDELVKEAEAVDLAFAIDIFRSQ